MEPKSEPRSPALRLLIAVSPIVVMVGLGYLFSDTPGASDDIAVLRQIDRPALSEAARRRLIDSLERAKSRADQENEAAIRSCDERIRGVVEKSLRQARVEAERAAKSLGSYGNSARLAYLMTRDRITGSDQSAEYVQEELALVCNSLAHAAAVAEAEATALEAEIEANQNRFATEIVTVLEGVDSEALRMSLEESWRRISDVSSSGATTISGKRLGASAGLAIEAATLRLTVQMLRTTIATAGKVLQGVVSRLAGTASTSGGAALIDGPVPVGDIIGAVIAIGGGIWCAYDLYEAHQTLPGELRRDLAEEIEATGETMTEAIEGHLELLQRNLQRSNADGVRQLTESITDADT